MAWARYDDEVAWNKKVARLRSIGVEGIAAFGLHVLANTWSRHEGTAGHVPAYMPEQLAGRPGPKLAKHLATVGMFDACADHPECWYVHDFPLYSDPNDDGLSAAERKRRLSEARSEAGRRGGLAKAANAKQRASNPGSKPEALLEQPPSNGLPPSPSPIPREFHAQESSPSPHGHGQDDDDDQFARTLELVVDAKVAAYNPDRPRAYRMAVRTNTLDEDGEVIARMLAEGDAPEVVALFVLGHGLSSDARTDAVVQGSVPWCDDTCSTCGGCAFVDTGDGLAPCPDRHLLDRTAQ